MIFLKQVKGQGLVIKSNGGVNLRATKQGTVKGYSNVWYLKKSLGNFLSFAKVCKKSSLQCPLAQMIPLRSFKCIKG